MVYIRYSSLINLLVRIIGGEIVPGKTEAEISAETAERRTAEINAELREIDTQSGRAARAVAIAVAAGKTPAKADVDRLAALEAGAAALRAELKTLTE
jgi:hypothetical protein